MTQPKEKLSPEESEIPAVPETPPPADENVSSAAAAPAAVPTAPLPSPREAELEDEIAGLKDKLLRALAEGENMRRRAERDRDEAVKYAASEFAREILTVADNLRRAVEAIGEEQRKADPALDNLAVGVEMTERVLHAAFDRFGIRRIEAVGQPFDHNRHEALFEIEDTEKPAGTVLQVVESGYTIHSRLLRPAKVGISKGGPKPGSAEAAGEPASEPKAETAGKASAYEKKGAAGAGGTLDEKL